MRYTSYEEVIVLPMDAFAWRAALRGRLSAVCCGFLLSRGIAGGARCAGWDMLALTENHGGSIWGAMIFCLACAVCCILRGEYAGKVPALLNFLTAAAYTLHRLLSPSAHGDVLALADGAAVLAALFFAGESRPGTAQTALLTLLLIPLRLCSLPQTDPLSVLRLSALTGVLCSAGLCGAAIVSLSGSVGRDDGAWIALGAATGFVQV